ncbi:aminotransferase class IV [Acuticoccus kandeliae]|uniref:aminotransferase class IV n=1 Tax=Acuticoccus kandeliae TaxID=2073160 RepID=UPI000D3E9D8A|nr:aminotransferase class IV [Acuticoccus kandeliae]
MTNFAERDGFIWVDGALVPWSRAKVHVLTHALHYGGAVFEGIRAYGGRLFLAEAHFARLARSAKLVGYRVPWGSRTLAAASETVVRANGEADAYVRPIAWRGAERLGVSAREATIHVAISAWDWPTPYRLGNAAEGVRLTLAPWRRPAPHTAPTASKCSGLTMIGTLSRDAALAEFYDDALMLDHAGHVADTTATNIIALIEGRLVSPPPTAFLDSITKRHVFELARGMGLAVEERTLALEDLRCAREMMVVGTSVEVLPVRELATPDWIATWPLGPVTARLIALFHASTEAHAAA